MNASSLSVPAMRYCAPCTHTSSSPTRIESTRAERRANVVFVNRVGQDKDLDFWGGSEVVDPFGSVVSAAEGNTEEVILAELDLQQVREARTIINTVRDEDLDFIQRRLQKVMGKHYV